MVSRVIDSPRSEIIKQNDGIEEHIEICEFDPASELDDTASTFVHIVQVEIFPRQNEPERCINPPYQAAISSASR